MEALRGLLQQQAAEVIGALKTELTAMHTSLAVTGVPSQASDGEPDEEEDGQAPAEPPLLACCQPLQLLCCGCQAPWKETASVPCPPAAPAARQARELWSSAGGSWKTQGSEPEPGPQQGAWTQAAEDGDHEF
ncbi:hypothetical protein DUNSADRAFT_16552 [Dunaliella salina]|uniref:Encoded protein n=1 Tax=Dunaliella salina TaxID=3046 RepID=A0ABQ7G3C5_DUNSA|nr:hypothetical protein DUNSADRAFT_16552 [Dunaliella salina]|eukprot:KAF5829100.1 hypothetical protein DUNSADRAFT_16552 [Dunaliella salina]